MASIRITDVGAGLIMGERFARSLRISNRRVCEESG
jgi:hypothetical protein